VRTAYRAVIAAFVTLAGGGAVLLAATQGDSDEGAPPAAGSRADRWAALSGAGLARTEVAAARIGRHVYVVGGFEERSGATTRAVERYDIRRDSWKRVRSMPVGLNHATAVTYRGKLYVHGGYRGRRDLSSATARLFRYHPGRNRWTRLPLSSTRRAAHAAAVIRGRLYVAGGANASGSLRSLEIYNFRRRRWRRGPSFPGPARNHTTGVASGGLFHVLAGRDDRNFKVAERYDPRRRRWQRLPSLKRARGGIASTRLSDGRIVVFGGEELGAGGTTIREVELFNPRSRRWRRLPDMRTPRHGLGGVARGSRVFAVEGGPRPGFHFSKAIEFLDVD
jgi:N-acetylneuraminic acid mutarotase